MNKYFNIIFIKKSIDKLYYLLISTIKHKRGKSGRFIQNFILSMYIKFKWKSWANDLHRFNNNWRNSIDYLQFIEKNKK